MEEEIKNILKEMKFPQMEDFKKDLFNVILNGEHFNHNHIEEIMVIALDDDVHKKQVVEAIEEIYNAGKESESNQEYRQFLRNFSKNNSQIILPKDPAYTRPVGWNLCNRASNKPLSGGTRGWGSSL